MIDISTRNKLLIFLFVCFLVIIYKTYNPYDQSFFPKCIFLNLTGLKCPGCGSQRAIHYILNLEIANAFNENKLVVMSIPYIAINLIFLNLKRSHPLLKYREFLFGEKAIYILLLVIITFFIIRNI